MGEFTASSLGVWHSLRPHEIAELFTEATFLWWIAGGWAIDLFVGRQTREHDDIDVQVLRRDQHIVRAALQGWDVQAAHPEERGRAWPFREWAPDAPLDPAVHDVWCRPNKTAPWAIQLMIADTDGADTDGEEWLFRRDRRVRRPLSGIGRHSADGIPYLAPEIQLLYKSRNSRPKDDADFTVTLPLLDHQGRQWLTTAIALIQPDHLWLIKNEEKIGRFPINHHDPKPDA